MWQFCYFVVSLYDETLCISFGAHKPNRVSCPFCYMNVAMAIVVLLHVHVCSICHVIIYYCTLHWYHIAINLIWFDLNTETFDPPDTIVWYWIGTNKNSGFTNVLLIRNVWLCDGLYTITNLGDHYLAFVTIKRNITNASVNDGYLRDLIRQSRRYLNPVLYGPQYLLKCACAGHPIATRKNFVG